MAQISPLINLAIFVAGVIVIIVLLTIYIYYRRQNFSCDSSPFFYGYTDWQCDAGTNNALGQRVDNLECHLKALYGALTDQDDCPSFNNRNNPCAAAQNEDSVPSFCTPSDVSSTYTDPYNSCVCNNGENVNSFFSTQWNNVANEPDSSCAGADCYNPNTTGCNLFPNLYSLCA
jgi:hypothetical protein